MLIFFFCNLFVFSVFSELRSLNTRAFSKTRRGKTPKKLERIPDITQFETLRERKNMMGLIVKQ